MDGSKSSIISIHALLAESDFVRFSRCPSRIEFLSTLSLRRATIALLTPLTKKPISIHALLAESDNARPEIRRPYAISIHALLAESDERANRLTHAPPQISIHALLAESDLFTLLCDLLHHDFYPRSPCGERQLYINRTAKAIIFLSTLSLRRATAIDVFLAVWAVISIHALLAESDVMHALKFADPMLFLSTLSLRRATREPTALRTPHHRFLSTLSLRRATCLRCCAISCITISIHALLAESDNCTSIGRPKRLYFYPRSPCGERRLLMCFWPFGRLFLSTLSLRRATCLRCCAISCITISIHALLAESDNCTSIGRPKRLYFYPRSPCGERRLLMCFWPFGRLFLSTLSLRRAT